MKIKILSICILIALLNSCSTPIPETSETPFTPTSTTEPGPPLNEHFKTVSSLVSADYLVREPVQTPISIAWGPDGNLYIADFIGRRIMVMDPSGEFFDLVLTENIFWGDGPRSLAFSPEGVLYVNTHNSIFSIDSNHTPTRLAAVGGNPVGSIAFSPSGEFFYTNRDAGAGDIRHWKDGAYEYVVKDLPMAENMAFAPDGTMYVSQMGLGKVYKVNVETHEISLFYSTIEADPIYMAVDAEGDVWVRGIDYLAQLSADGQDKPYILDGRTVTGNEYLPNITTPAAIAFDASGTLWIPGYTSIISRFVPKNPGVADPEYHQELFFPGLSLSSIDTNSRGELFGIEWLLGQVDKIEPNKVTPIAKYGCSGGAEIAIDANDRLFVSACGKMMVMDESGAFTDYAAVFTENMDFGADGVLYAIQGDNDDEKTLVKITGKDEVTTLGDTFAGVTLGDSPVNLSAWNNGLYLFVEKQRKLIFMDYEGNARLINLASEIGGGSGPVPMISTATGQVILIPHGPYEMFLVDQEGALTKYAEQIYGDPLDFALSPDGKWLYISESGAVIKMELQ